MKVIIDTDPGIDDAMALLFAHYANDIELLGITTVFGNGTIDTVTQNTLTICEQFQINAPVHQGAGAPLQVAVDPPPELRGEPCGAVLKSARRSLEASASRGDCIHVAWLHRWSWPEPSE